ncbi:hypothetical protein [Flavobacterium humi]|uniref:DUF4595 domain-containing protein n=1 Tax=Flavobacterium humi TaxID=2562683 RepID=A0A4Z0L3T1_9FLAO|nr:hypothetical protein [Flavobacterium humi]TGD56905.1 hypothetical protein E4635_14005 [Flavobacterium humi]
MRKLMYVFSFFAVFFSSCSNDDSSNPGFLLVKKATSENGSSTYRYDGNKLVQVTINASDYVVNTYNGNLITKTARYYADGTLLTETLYEYNANQKLISQKLLFHQNLGLDPTSQAFRRVFTYNPDNTLTYEEYSGTFQNQTTLTHTGKMWLDSEGQTLKTEDYRNGYLFSTEEFTYDTEKTIFENAAGMQKVPNSNSGFAKHNILTYKYYNSMGNLVNGFSNQMTFNAEGYPTEINMISLSGARNSVQFTY